MRRAFSFLALLAAACASQQGPSAKIPEPEVVIEQLSSVVPAARNIDGPLALQYRIHVKNRAAEAVTLKRIDLNSVGYGSYSVGPTSRAFDLKVAPGAEEAAEFWTNGQIVDPSLTGANGPVTLRAVAHFDASSGRFQTVVIQQVRPQGVPE
jgi:hypothetical protein